RASRVTLTKSLSIASWPTMNVHFAIKSVFFEQPLSLSCLAPALSNLICAPGVDVLGSLFSVISDSGVLFERLGSAGAEICSMDDKGRESGDFLFPSDNFLDGRLSLNGLGVNLAAKDLSGLSDRFLLQLEPLSINLPEITFL